jgi:hypothetical protein
MSKEVIYTCNQCLQKYTSDEELMTIGSEDGKSLMMRTRNL